MTKKARIGCWIAVVAPFLFGIYASCVEPRWLEVTHHDVELPVQAPLTIAHISDLHVYRLGAIEEKTLRAVTDAKPDLIVITGDLYDRSENKSVADEFVSKLNAPLGVFYVPGNWEHWVSQESLELKNAPTLINSAMKARDDVWIVGIDDSFAGIPNLTQALDGVQGGVVIGLFHSPAFFDVASSKIDLALAGHTHGGQVRVPFVGAVWLPQQSGAYVAGWYQRERAKMFVSRGIGTSVLPVRFNCRPELALIRVSSSNGTR
jgi:uncharacterized protein